MSPTMRSPINPNPAPLTTWPASQPARRPTITMMIRLSFDRYMVLPQYDLVEANICRLRERARCREGFRRARRRGRARWLPAQTRPRFLHGKQDEKEETRNRG